MSRCAVSGGVADDTADPMLFEKPGAAREITPLIFVETIALIAICLSAGRFVSDLMQGYSLEVPTFVYVLFIGVILSNTLSWLGFIVFLNTLSRFSGM